jgi:hypothetical protein
VPARRVAAASATRITRAMERLQVGGCGTLRGWGTIGSHRPAVQEDGSFSSARHRAWRSGRSSWSSSAGGVRNSFRMPALVLAPLGGQDHEFDPAVVGDGPALGQPEALEAIDDPSGVGGVAFPFIGQGPHGAAFDGIERPERPRVVRGEAAPPEAPVALRRGAQEEPKHQAPGTGMSAALGIDWPWPSRPDS